MVVGAFVLLYCNVLSHYCTVSMHNVGNLNMGRYAMNCWEKQSLNDGASVAKLLQN